MGDTFGLDILISLIIIIERVLCIDHNLFAGLLCKSCFFRHAHRVRLLDKRLLSKLRERGTLSTGLSWFGVYENGFALLGIEPI